MPKKKTEKPVKEPKEKPKLVIEVTPVVLTFD
jgi:hypothetical protein